MSTSSATLATLAVLSIVISALGTRGRWFHFRIGLLLFAVAGLLGALALIIGAFAWYRGSMTGAVAAIAGALVLLGPLYGIVSAAGKPMIHDITTDLDDPPRFETLRVAAYDPANAPIQRKAYADVQPLTVKMPMSETFARAKAAMESRGWEIAAARPEAGALEATATTGFFGFKDDVVVRIRPVQEGSRIDVRSVSRVGKSDVGMNAKRIREYLAGFTK